jgi:hypothetical protein
VFNASCAHTPTHIPSSTSHTCQKGWGWEKMQPHCSFEHAHRIPITIALALTAPTTPFPPMRKQAHSCSGLHFFTLDAKMHVFARSCLGVDRTGATACIHHGHSSCIRSNAGARGASHSFGTGSRKHRQTHTHTPCFAAKVSRGVQVRPPTPFCTPFIRGKKGVATFESTRICGCRVAQEGSG